MCGIGWLGILEFFCCFGFSVLGASGCVFESGFGVSGCINCAGSVLEFL